MKRLASLVMAICLCSSLAIAAAASEIGSEEETENPMFPFTVYLKDEDGNILEDTFTYVGTVGGQEGQTGTIASGDTIYLADSDYIDILNLPEGTQYEVIEGDSEGYTLDSSMNTTGVIMTDAISHAQFVNRENDPPVEPGKVITISIHGSKVIGQGKATTSSEPSLQITKLVSDYTTNSAEWMGPAEDRTFTIHVMALDGEVSKDIVSAAEGVMVSKSYDAETGIGSITVKDKGYAWLPSIGQADTILVWEDFYGDDLGPYYETGFSGEGTALTSGDMSQLPGGQMAGGIRLDSTSWEKGSRHYVTIYNNVKPRAQLSFYATDNYGNPLGGFTYVLKESTGETIEEKSSSDQNPIVFDQWLPENNYIINETSYQNGYSTEKEDFPVEVVSSFKAKTDTFYEQNTVANLYSPLDTDQSNPIKMIYHLSMSTLPSTGGPGVTTVTMTGYVLMLLGGLGILMTLNTRRNESNEKSN